MRCTNGLPDKQTVGYTLLELVAISGELPANQLCRLPGGDSYKLNVVRALKSQKLLRMFPNAFPFRCPARLRPIW